MSAVTIFADASVNPRKKIAGIGAWAKGDDRDSVTYGAPLEYTPGVTLCELKALRMMIEHLIEKGYLWPTDDYFMLQSDCLQALWIINKCNPSYRESKHPEGASIKTWNQRSKPSTGQTREARRIGELLENCTVTLRHVKGHKEGGGRQWVNDTCDKLAKRAAHSGETMENL